jgi:hypothetical protein
VKRGVKASRRLPFMTRHQTSFGKSCSNSITISDFLRLILNGVRISGIGHDDEKYTFTYRPFETDRNTRSIDEWGYYNGADNHTLVPTISTTATLTSPFMTVDVSMPGADRQPNEQAMQQGILTGITYPTGGRSEFLL